MTSAPVRDPIADHLLTPQNAAFVLIDYQPSQLAGVHSMDHDLLVKNAVSTVRTIKTFDVPVVHSTINVATGRGGPTLPELAQTRCSCGFCGDLGSRDRSARHAFALFLRFLQVRGLADALRSGGQGRVEPPTFRFQGGSSITRAYCFASPQSQHQTIWLTVKAASRRGTPRSPQFPTTQVRPSAPARRVRKDLFHT